MLSGCTSTKLLIWLVLQIELKERETIVHTVNCRPGLNMSEFCMAVSRVQIWSETWEKGLCMSLLGGSLHMPLEDMAGGGYSCWYSCFHTQFHAFEGMGTIRAMILGCKGNRGAELALCHYSLLLYIMISSIATV